MSYWDDRPLSESVWSHPSTSIVRRNQRSKELTNKAFYFAQTGLPEYRMCSRELYELRVIHALEESENGAGK